MSDRPKILLLDDDQAFLDLYQEMLMRTLPSRPEVLTASSGNKALVMLESESMNLLCVDLNMPKMDGLQVLSIARRKFPQLRMVVLTGLRDEQFRTRAYAMGIDQDWIKPESEQDMRLFMESIESLLSGEMQGGFRGVQSKSLVDIIQLECLSQSTTLLRITNGHAEGRIWIHQGEVIDAVAQELCAEPAFQRILSWKTGNFEMLPSDQNLPRRIFTSYQGLLLNTAQAFDEAASQISLGSLALASADATPPSPVAPMLAELSELPGVEFVLAIRADAAKTRDFWGLEDPAQLAQWTQETLGDFRALGERLRVGPLHQVVGISPELKLALAPCGEAEICIGFPNAQSVEQVRETMKNIVNKWAS